jgi:hypothetical protein
LEPIWERAFNKLFTRQAKAVLSRFEGKRGHKFAARAPEPDGLFDPSYWESETDDLARGLYEQVAAQGLIRVSDSFGVSFDLNAPGVDLFIRDRAQQLAGQVTKTTYNAIRDQMTEGINAGESIPDLAARITSVFDATTARATTIARTEVISAYNGAALEGMRAVNETDSELVGGQEWIATGDDRCRDEHQDAQDAGPVGFDEFFIVGGEQLQYPGDPAGSPENVINCRCTIAFLTPDEYAAAVDEERSKPREVRVSTAKALLGMPFDEHGWRTLLRSTAA